MNYVKSFDLFGVSAMQIPSITGSGAPTTATEGAIGCLYMDTTTGYLYKCTAAASGVYTWEDAGGNVDLSGFVQSVNGNTPDLTGNVEIKTGGVNVNCKIIAHRGYYATAKENTLQSFIDAADNGFKWLEVDIRQCADGIYVVAHDNAITLYNNGSAVSVTVSASNYADIKSYTWDAAGLYKICTLQAVFVAMKSKDVSIICDLKSGANAEIVQLAAMCGIVDKILLSYGSFGAAYNQIELLNKYDNIPIRCVPSDYANYAKLASAIANPIYADVNCVMWDHYRSYFNIALSCGVPILFSGCTKDNRNRWQVLAAGCMANANVNPSYADFVTMLDGEYDVVNELSVGTSAIQAVEGYTVSLAATSTATTAGGYIYAYSENPTVAKLVQATFGNSVSLEITGVTVGSTNLIVFCGSGDICKIPITIVENTGVTYTVTNTLTNATNNNSAESVVEYCSYTANLTANSGYTLDGAVVTVTMGGTDVTADVYSDGVVNIFTVTGDIVITVAAAEKPEPVYYSITNTLTNVSSNNSTATVEEGTSYTATLTVTDGYELESVTVTMGGTDVTSSVYATATGKVSISAVTGNVVITATANVMVEPETLSFVIGIQRYTEGTGGSYDGGTTYYGKISAITNPFFTPVESVPATFSITPPSGYQVSLCVYAVSDMTADYSLTYGTASATFPGTRVYDSGWFTTAKDIEITSGNAYLIQARATNSATMTEDMVAEITSGLVLRIKY